MDRLIIIRQNSCESGVKEIGHFSVVPGLVAAPSFGSRDILETEVSQNEEIRDMEYAPQIEELHFPDGNGYEEEPMSAMESMDKFEAQHSLTHTQDLTEPAGDVDGMEPGVTRIEKGQMNPLFFSLGLILFVSVKRVE